MKRIWNIYKTDIKNIVTNYAAFITVAALCILPSLYAWFNIAASWDPYAKEATSQIKIGVINNDDGTEVEGKEINMGDLIVHGLKENELMGWQFVDDDEAEQMLEQGKFYATITIPPQFSKDITSIITSNIKKGDIIYKVNEKINAIAPKLTDKGASGVQENISKTLIETVSSTLLNATKSIGIELENIKPKITNVYNLLKEVQGEFDDINSTVDLAYKGAIQLKDLTQKIIEDIPLIKTTIDNSKDLSNEIKSFLTNSKASLNDLNPTIKEDIRLLSEISGGISDYASAISDAINSGSDKVPGMIENLEGKLNSIGNLTNSLLKVVEKLNKISPKLDSTVEKLRNINASIESTKENLIKVKNAVNSGTTPDLSVLNNIKSLSESVKAVADDLYSKYDSDIAVKINSIIDTAYSTSDNIISILDESEKKLPNVSELLNTAYEGADKGISGIKFIKEELPQAEEMINSLVGKMDKANNDEGLKELLELLRNDVEERSDFLANPVNLVEEELFPMGNYGTAMTPFYTTLALWAGCLFLVSLLSVNPHNTDNLGNKFLNVNRSDQPKQHKKIKKEALGYAFKITEEYFGKLLLFVTLAIIQGFVVSIGDLYILDIYCINPGIFIFVSIITGITFSLIIYTACSVFGNVGKVICIVLLVFQIGGSSGTFPIELTPKFFQSIHPFLPFTYTISLMREMIGGMVKEVVIKDCAIILIFIGISLLIGIFLKTPFNKFIKKFNEKFEESHLGE
ncbi:YhgE/Pip domain-containing protein [Clostridium butyricum]|uniref:YhgE/Pip domain-containing protein n=1 Tax=Clostridium butyricum TaxID=1492 RepID=UPI002106CD7F|nr:YhgE/Pip domain-containing protein [Clostridium butyricum]MCQ2014059.1 YhgE/Pip domain-containing protein [Clostridium butyricum]MCQ2026150.1 YhgE/Pip domain-containing protein [Clostridium butyricum]